MISKVMFRETSAEREFSMNEVVRKIPGHEEWAILWDTLCETPEYRKISKTSDIDDCLDKKQVSHTPQQSYPMLVGPFGGKALDDYAQDVFKALTFKSQTKFDEAVLHVFRVLQNVFVALQALRSHRVAHADITVRNILVHGPHSYLIDFGLAYLFSNTKYVRGHLKFLFQGTDRIYEAYPYEYCLYHGHTDTKGLASEFKDLKKGIHRENHEEYLHIHGDVLGKGHEDVERHLHTLMKRELSGTPPQLSRIIQSLDTYSVGMLLPILIYDVCHSLKIPIATATQRCRDSAHPEIFALLRDMTQYESKDRVSPEAALKRYHTILDASKI